MNMINFSLLFGAVTASLISHFWFQDSWFGASYRRAAGISKPSPQPHTAIVSFIGLFILAHIAVFVLGATGGMALFDSGWITTVALLSLWLILAEKSNSSWRQDKDQALKIHAGHAIITASVLVSIPILVA